MVPADQSFRAGDPVDGEFELGLVQHLQIAAFDGDVEFTHQRDLLFQRGLAGILVIGPGIVRPQRQAGGVDRAGNCPVVRDAIGQRHIDPAPGHFDRVAHDRAEAGELTFQLVEFVRAHPGQRPVVDAVDRPLASADQQAILDPR